MIFSVSNDGFEWSLDFALESLTLTVKDLVQKMTISSQEVPLAAWSLLFSQKRQQFSNNHLAQVPANNPKPARNTWTEERNTFKCKCTRRFGHKRVSGVCWSGRCWILLGKWSARCLCFFETGHWYSFLINSVWWLRDGRFSRKPHSFRRQEQDRENSLPPPTTPVSERPTQLPSLLRSRSFGAREENVPDYVSRNLFQYILPCLCFNKIYNWRVSFYHNLFQKLVRHVRQKQL